MRPRCPTLPPNLTAALVAMLEDLKSHKVYLEGKPSWFVIHREEWNIIKTVKPCILSGGREGKTRQDESY